MASSTEAAAPEASVRNFSQVVFIDIPRSYPPKNPVTCCYTLSTAFQPHPRDWVGIFKVGWSTAKEYHTFVWVEPCLDVVGQQTVTRQAVFSDYYLPKDEIEFYQFCYVDNAGQVRGASTPFCFRNSAEQSMESSPDDDLLVITTQDQVEQSVREKAQLQKELNQIMEENETLKTTLQKEQQEAANLKGLNEEKEKEKSELVKELDHVKEENENLKSTIQQQLKEVDHLKEEMLTQKTKQTEIQEHSAAEQKKKSLSLSLEGASQLKETHAQEKYDRAVMKINQLKEEREELRGRVEAQSDEIITLNSKSREAERELYKLRDSIQLLRVDLQSSEKGKERLSEELLKLQSLMHNVDDIKRENEELCRRLLQQETPQSCPDDDLRKQCQALARQLQDAQAMLRTEKEETRNTKRRVEYLEKELQHIRDQQENVISSYDQSQLMCGKQELQLREAHEAIAEKDGMIEDQERMITLVTQEKEALARENQNLINDMEELRRVYADLHAAPPADQAYVQPDPIPPADTTSSTREWQQPETPEESENLYETIDDVPGPEEETLVCRHCQESFPLITQLELEQHEQSHRVCPFCTMICDNMEQSVFEDHVYSHEL